MKGEADLKSERSLGLAATVKVEIECAFGIGARNETEFVITDESRIEIECKTEARGGRAQCTSNTALRERSSIISRNVCGRLARGDTGAEVNTAREDVGRETALDSRFCVKANDNRPNAEPRGRTN
ncbi:hypothetical protein EVAR_102389_1 [Eumeta japonica]|uniref:Uncharacterized protein n=1 Tax=Eumeta variegata TaxID=151549 RepID=A0A4C1YPX2_EUMVA|nr:hypothetical protein EVAR_102389_1 [Eumeta japonica]